MFTTHIYLLYMYKPDEALNNPQRLICHKTKPNKVFTLSILRNLLVFHQNYCLTTFVFLVCLLLFFFIFFLMHFYITRIVFVLFFFSHSTHTPPEFMQPEKPGDKPSLGPGQIQSVQPSSVSFFFLSFFLNQVRIIYSTKCFRKINIISLSSDCYHLRVTTEVMQWQPFSRSRSHGIWLIIKQATLLKRNQSSFFLLKSPQSFSQSRII